MPALFISYRRSDSSDITGRIFDRLVGHFGNKPVKVIRDVDSIPVGEDFREVLRERIRDCDVVLVIIGPIWATVKDSKGGRRLDDAADTVRIEIEQALELKKKVIPICVTHAPMPTGDDLPETLKALAFRNGVQVRPDPDFNTDIGRLLTALEKIFKEKQIAEAKPPTLPPPQRHFVPPEPPPPPFPDSRRSSGSHGPAAPAGGAGVSPFAPAPKEQPAAPTPEKTPAAPQRKTDSSPGPWQGAPKASQVVHPPPPARYQPPHYPLPGRGPGSTNFFTSAIGIAIILTVLASICMCGGFFLSFFTAFNEEFRKELNEQRTGGPGSGDSSTNDSSYSEKTSSDFPDSTPAKTSGDDPFGGFPSGK